MLEIPDIVSETYPTVFDVYDGRRIVKFDERIVGIADGEAMRKYFVYHVDHSEAETHRHPQRIQADIQRDRYEQFLHEHIIGDSDDHMRDLPNESDGSDVTMTYVERQLNKDS